MTHYPPSCSPPCATSTWADGNIVGPVVAPAAFWSPVYDRLQVVPQGWAGGDAQFLEPARVLGPTARPSWHVSITADEKMFQEADASIFLRQGPSSEDAKRQAMSGALPSSQLKARIEWVSAYGYRTYVIADVGSGIEMVTPPSNHVSADLLIPKISPEYPPPPALADLEGYITATVLRTRATPVEPGSFGWQGTYTQTRVVVAGAAIFEAIPPYAKWARIFIAPPTVGTVQLVPPTGTVEAQFLFDRQTPAGAPALYSVGNIGLVGPGPTDRIDIPQNAKYLSIGRSAGAGDSVVTVVYGLSL